MIDERNGVGFGKRATDLDFYESADRDKAWVNLESEKQTFTGRVSSYLPKEQVLVMDRHVGIVYYPEGRIRNEIISGDIEILIGNMGIHTRYRTTEKEAMARVECYNRELSAKRPNTFWNDLEEPQAN